MWSGKQVTVYELSGTVLRNTGAKLTKHAFYSCGTSETVITAFSFVILLLVLLSTSPDIPGSFPCDSHVVAVHSENLYTVEPNRVQIRTPQVCSSVLKSPVLYYTSYILIFYTDSLKKN